MKIARSTLSLVAPQSRRSLRQAASPRALLESLETRQMMAKTEIITFQADQWALTLTGPGTFADVQATVTPFGIPLIALTGTTIASNFSVSRVTPPFQRSTSTLNIETITGGTLNSITLEADSVDLESQNLAPRGVTLATGILLTGYARTITVGDIFGADIRLQSTSNQNRSTISARQIVGSQPLQAARGVPGVDDSNITSGGVIDSFTADNYTFGTIQAARIGSITINNDVAARGPLPFVDPEFDIITTSTTATFGVKTIDVRGALFDGNWQIAAPVQRITIGDVIDNDFLRGGSSGFTIDVQGRIGQLICQDDLRGTATAASFGSIQVADLMDMEIITDGAASNSVNSIDSIRAASYRSNITATNGIGLINVGTVSGSTVNAGWIDFLNVTGAPNGVSEIVTSSTINLNNTVRTSLLRKMNVQGNMSSSTFSSVGNVGDVVMRGLINSQFVVGAPAFNAFPTNAAQLGTRSINSFTLTAPIGAAPNFVNSGVAAATFNTLRINSPVVTTANGGTTFGFAANVINSLFYTAGPGVNVTATNVILGVQVQVDDFRISVL